MILPGSAFPYITRLVHGSAGWERACGHVEKLRIVRKPYEAP
ncbi:hypothetical protein BIFCAT_01385 [Bifidobacterium catenulatum DSM 16992 = JCM 1194 = LMG 11043]|uniref:Uncharacterized protein n=1 Tax=Bifidobacterium catenulatum DSM 16992 = JCM 1194 = LMG 11043 TaxID=566552 RepID=B6XVW8_9BIFI|nr:hypothetical protein BIFCAT_01385 [Bifidobacterium catenulatum DSM 16992 = JCM 1194 = LMG 11043]